MSLLSSLKLRGRTSQHVACCCSEESQTEHPSSCDRIYRESTGAELLPPILQQYMREDLRDFKKVMDDGELLEEEEIQKEQMEEEEEEEEIEGEGIEGEGEEGDDTAKEGVPQFCDDIEYGAEEEHVLSSTLEETTKKQRVIYWQAVFKARGRRRMASLARVADKIVTSKELKAMLKSLSVAVNKRLKNKKGMAECLMLFYGREIALRTSSTFLYGSVRKWNVTGLVQVLKVRYRNYSTAVACLYAQ
jgi:hypothetical protein